MEGQSVTLQNETRNFQNALQTLVEAYVEEIIKNHDVPTVSSDRTLDIKEAAEYMGVSQKTLYNMCSKKKIPHRKLGARILFSLMALDRWGKEQDYANYLPET